MSFNDFSYTKKTIKLKDMFSLFREEKTEIVKKIFSESMFFQDDFYSYFSSDLFCLSKQKSKNLCAKCTSISRLIDIDKKDTFKDKSTNQEFYIERYPLNLAIELHEEENLSVHLSEPLMVTIASYIVEAVLFKYSLSHYVKEVLTAFSCSNHVTVVTENIDFIDLNTIETEEDVLSLFSEVSNILNLMNEIDLVLFDVKQSFGFIKTKEGKIMGILNNLSKVGLRIPELDIDIQPMSNKTICKNDSYVKSDEKTIKIEIDYIDYCRIKSAPKTLGISYSYYNLICYLLSHKNIYDIVRNSHILMEKWSSMWNSIEDGDTVKERLIEVHEGKEMYIFEEIVKDMPLDKGILIKHMM